MSKKRFSVKVRGKTRTWMFDFYADPKYWDEWEEDGLDVVMVVNTIPVWVVELGLMRVWIAAQDIFNFKWPWRKS